MQEMAEPKDANKSINLAYSVMTLVYAFTTIVAYGLEGRSVEGFLLDSLPDSPVKRVASGLLAFHVIVAYAIVSVPLTNFFYGLCFPNTPIHNGGVPARLRWALISIGYLVFSYLIATLIPVCRAPLTHTHTHTHTHTYYPCIGISLLLYSKINPRMD